MSSNFLEAGFKHALLNFDLGHRMAAAEGYREAVYWGKEKHA